MKRFAGLEKVYFASLGHEYIFNVFKSRVCLLFDTAHVDFDLAL